MHVRIYVYPGVYVNVNDKKASKELLLIRMRDVKRFDMCSLFLPSYKIFYRRTRKRMKINELI